MKTSTPKETRFVPKPGIAVVLPGALAVVFRLVSCPFCGSKPNVMKGKRYKSDGATAKYIIGHRPGDWIWRPQIGCKKCRITRVGDDVEELIAWWNTRTANDKTEARGA